jgi:hypothetical protein
VRAMRCPDRTSRPAVAPFGEEGRFGRRASSDGSADPMLWGYAPASRINQIRSAWQPTVGKAGSGRYRLPHLRGRRPSKPPRANCRRMPSRAGDRQVVPHSARSTDDRYECINHTSVELCARDRRGVRATASLCERAAR